MKKKALSDRQRIMEIIKILIEPYCELEHMNTESKLWSTIQPENYPIYRRKILKSMKVFGMWWMDEEQSCQFLWNGHKGIVIKSDQDPDRVMATRTLGIKKRDGTFGWCYIRENANETYELEAMSFTKDAKNRTVADWMTVSITKSEYESLDSCLGPVHDGCKHGYEGMMG